MRMTNQQAKDCVNALEKSQDWINSLMEKFGTNAVLECMPNNWGGRIDLRRQANDIKAYLPEIWLK